MFSMLPIPAPTHLQTHYYTPAVSSPLSSSPLRRSPISSPLSPRSANLPTPTRSYLEKRDSMMSSPSKTPSISTKGAKTPSTTSSRSSAFSKRATKPNPLLHKNDEEGRETRRKLFLKKVKEGSEDKRWKARGGEDEMMRTIWVMEERRRLARQREIFGDMEGEDEGYLTLDEVIAEELEDAEEREMQALLGLMGEELQAPEEVDMDAPWEGTQEHISVPATNETETPYGSDDDEYDHIFMDVIQEEKRMSSQQLQPPQADADADQDMMDMS